MIATVERLIEILRAKVQKKNVEYHDLGVELEWKLNFDEDWCCISICAYPLGDSFTMDDPFGSGTDRFFWQEDKLARIDEWLDPLFEKAMQAYIKSKEEGIEND